jgi:hypothetical protein
VPNSIIESKGVSNIPTRPIEVVDRPIKIEISKKYPVYRITNIMTTELINEFSTSRLITGTIDRCKLPGFVIVHRTESNSDAKTLLV